MPIASASRSNVVIVRLSSFGDIILTEPVTRALKGLHPRCSLWFATGSAYSGIPAMFPEVDKVIVYSRQGGNRGLAEAANEVEFDLVVDLQNNRRSRSVTRMLRARSIVRHKRQRVRRFLSVYVPWIWKGPLRHTVETYFDVFGAPGPGVGDIAPVIRPPGGCLEQAVGYLGSGSSVGLCPGGSSEHKRWSDEQFVDLIGLLRLRGQQIAVIGAEQDRPTVESIIGMIGQANVRSYIGNNVGLTAALLSLCTVTVTNDSGLMHLGAAVGSKVISIFGPTSPALGFAPTAPGSVIMTRGLACSPCSFHGNRQCRYGTRECLESISPRDVAAQIGEMTKGSGTES